MEVTLGLAQEKIWFEKYKYEEAEKIYFESLAKLLVSDGYKKNSPEPKSPSPKPQTTAPLKEETPVPTPDILTYVTPSDIRMEDKRFKAKNRNKANKKEVEKKADKPVKQETKVSSNNVIMKNSLAEEVAKARQHIKSSLECVDGMAKFTTENIPIEINNRLNNLETLNTNLVRDVKDLTELVKKLSDRIASLEKSPSAKAAPAPAAAPTKTPAPAKPKVEDDDDGVDLFASESEEEDEEAKKVKEQRLADYAARKSKKPVLIAKSNIILDVKPWDDETDMKKLEAEVRTITCDGLIWGASKLVPLAYGIHKLQISCVVEDDKVSVDWLQEQIEEKEDYVQSVDIAAFNKV